MSQSGSTTLTGLPGALRNENERRAASMLSDLFDASPETTQVKLDNFTKYARLQTLTRFLTRYELFRLVREVKGSIVECGVFRGFGLMAWANLSAILEPANFQRRVYGFDTFEGFPEVTEQDRNRMNAAAQGMLSSNSLEELQRCIQALDANRYLGHMSKVELIQGDACQTIPQFIETHKHIVVSLLFLDFDLYEPTKIALETFLPRMPSGAVLAFDELDHPAWPGETMAALDAVGLNHLKLRRFDFEPYTSYAVLP